MKECIYATITIETPDAPDPQSWSAAPWWRRAVWAANWGLRTGVSRAVARRTYRHFRDQFREHIVHLVIALICLPLGLVLALTWPLTIGPWRIIAALVWTRDHEKSMRRLGAWPEEKDGGGL